MVVEIGEGVMMGRKDVQVSGLSDGTERGGGDGRNSRIEILGSSLFLQSVLAKLHRQHI